VVAILTICASIASGTVTPYHSQAFTGVRVGDCYTSNIGVNIAPWHLYVNEC
jgi:hypothetical protein